MIKKNNLQIFINLQIKFKIIGIKRILPLFFKINDKRTLTYKRNRIHLERLKTILLKKKKQEKNSSWNVYLEKIRPKTRANVSMV